MSEPKTQATALQRLPGGARHWTIHDERIDFRSESYAVPGKDGWVWIDPVGLLPPALESVQPIEAICITGRFHQRSAWRLRRETGADVWAPADATDCEEPATHRFEDGARLPGGLLAQRRTGPTQPHYVFLWIDDQAKRVLFMADLVMRGGAGPFAFVPPEHLDDPPGVRRSLRRLLDDGGCDRIYPAHGAPLVEGGTAALEQVLASDQPR